MRTFIIILCIVAALVVAVAVYLAVTTPRDAPPLRFPLAAAQQELLARVPSDAEAYAFVPAPVVLLRKLEANAVTRDAIARWREEQPLPPAMMLGRADAVIWRRGKATSYAVRFDPVRALLVRAWTLLTSADLRWHGRTLVINGGDAATPAPDDIPPLPEGDVLVVQRKGSRGAYPPIPRPTFTSLRMDGDSIDITSRARSADAAAAPPAVATLPRAAMLSVAFTDPPRLLGDFDRLLAADVDALVRGGGTIAVYRVDSGRLLPRPFAAIAVPANDASRAAVARYDRALQSIGEVLESGGRIVVAFDRDSAKQYVADAQVPMPWPANRWSVRLDPARLIPVLREIGDNPALRFATPRVHRGARDLRGWIGALERARTVEAAASAANGVEELRVRISTK